MTAASPGAPSGDPLGRLAPGPRGRGVPNERFPFAGVKGQVFVRGVKISRPWGPAIENRINICGCPRSLVRRGGGAGDIDTIKASTSAQTRAVGAVFISPVLQRGDSINKKRTKSRRDHARLDLNERTNRREAGVSTPAQAQKTRGLKARVVGFEREPTPILRDIRNKKKKSPRPTLAVILSETDTGPIAVVEVISPSTLPQPFLGGSGSVGNKPGPTP
jgi:hypothetical protein